MKKIVCFSLLCILTFFGTILPVKALTAWKYEDWQDGGDYGSKTRISSNITNLKGLTEEKDGMKVGPYNKASKAKLSDGIQEEVYVGLNLDDYQNSELFELSIALNQQGNAYLTEAVVMSQKSGNKFVLTANWAKDKNPIATIDKDGVYTYRWEFKKGSADTIQVRFSVLDYEKELGTTDFVELNVENKEKATDVRYLWACNIKANYGVDIYTVLPARPGSSIENPNTSDCNLFLVVGILVVSSLGLSYILKRKYA